MNNLEKYNKVFVSIFNVKEEELLTNFSIDAVDTWDSITQLSLVTELEDEFDVMFDTEDILEFKSYDKGRTILKKYDIKL